MEERSVAPRDPASPPSLFFWMVCAMVVLTTLLPVWRAGGKDREPLLCAYVEAAREDKLLKGVLVAAVQLLASLGLGHLLVRLIRKFRPNATRPDDTSVPPPPASPRSQKQHNRLTIVGTVMLCYALTACGFQLGRGIAPATSDLVIGVVAVILFLLGMSLGSD